MDVKSWHIELQKAQRQLKIAERNFNDVEPEYFDDANRALTIAQERFYTLQAKAKCRDAARWIGNAVLGPVESYMKECSNCHHIRNVDNFCSNCGSPMIMKGKENGESIY